MLPFFTFNRMRTRMKLDEKVLNHDAMFVRGRIVSVALLLFFQSSIIVVAYRYDFFGLFGTTSPQRVCPAVLGSEKICKAVGDFTRIVNFLIVVMGIAWVLKILPMFTRKFSLDLGVPENSLRWIATNCAGFLMLLAPSFLILSNKTAQLLSVLGPVLWLIGSMMFLIGLVRMLAINQALRQFYNWRVFGFVLILLSLPELTAVIGDRLWSINALRLATVNLTMVFLNLFGETAVWTAPDQLRLADFAVEIGFPCAGLSGIVFSAGVISVYIFLMRTRLRISRTLFLIPVAAVLSWCLNSLRIAILLLIGKYISPALAVNGFHSYAGWIIFTVLTGTLIFSADRLVWFQRNETYRSQTLHTAVLKDAVSAQILPFVVFIFSSLIVGAVFEIPTLGYPVRILATVITLIAFWQCVPKTFRLDINPIAYAAGALIAVVWIVAHNADTQPLSEMVPGLSGFSLLFWVVMRLFGTTFVVPIVEELFFRGYLLKRMSFGGRFSHLITILLTSILFGVLHGNFLLATAAGMLLAYVALSTGRILNAIVAHAIANGAIGLWALYMNDWSVI